MGLRVYGQEALQNAWDIPNKFLNKGKSRTECFAEWIVMFLGFENSGELRIV